jgi:NADH-quinone oxidoreductase subunit J
MLAVQISFFVLAVASTASALGVIVFKNAVHSALSLILTLLFLALFYLQLGAMFIAVVQILIYAGAIMVLFLFVVTMLAADQNDGETRDRISWQRLVGGVLGVVLVAALSYLLFTGASVDNSARATSGNSLSRVVDTYCNADAAHIVNTHCNSSIEAFGLALFHGFAFPFEVTSLLIVVAILGTMVFGRRA